MGLNSGPTSGQLRDAAPAVPYRGMGVVLLLLIGCVLGLSRRGDATDVFRLSENHQGGESPRRETRAARECNATAPSARYVRGDINSDAWHVAFLATHSPSLARMRRVVMDILNNTDADIDVVVHIISDKAYDTFLPALPLCSGLSVNLLNATLMMDAGTQRLCDIFGITRGHPKCYFLVKPMLYKWMPPEVDAVLILDSDARIIGDMRELLVDELAAQRAAGAPLGLAAEQQATYAGMIGGYSGFNGGVQLHDLRAMRAFGPAFDAFIDGLDPRAGITKFGQESVLGDQSLLTLLNLTVLGRTGGARGSPVIHLLPCVWNIQLCLFHSNMRTENRKNFPWIHVSSCKGRPRLIHGNGNMYDRYRLDEWDEKKLIAIVNRVKAVGRGAAPFGDRCHGGPVLETLGQYGSEADAR